VAFGRTRRRRAIVVPTERFHAPASVVFFVAALFISGVAFGSAAVKMLSPDQRAEMVAYVEAFVRGVARYTDPIPRGNVLQASLSNNLKTAIALWFCGVTVVGLPVTMAIVFTRGFVLGFAVAFLVDELGASGVLFSASSVIPHNLIAVPAILGLGVLSVSFTAWLVGSKRRGRGIDFLGEFSRYSLLSAVLLLALVVSSGIEAFVTPLLIKVVGLVVR